MYIILFFPSKIIGFSSKVAANDKSDVAVGFATVTQL